MILEEFLKEYSNDIISDELLTKIYICADIASEENMDDFKFLFPAIRSLYYYKNCFKKDVLKDYAIKDTLKYQTKERLFIYSLLDKGVEIDEIINYKYESIKNIISKEFECFAEIKRGPIKVSSDLRDTVFDLIFKELEREEIVVRTFKGTDKLNDKFCALCKLLDL